MVFFSIARLHQNQSKLGSIRIPNSVGRIIHPWIFHCLLDHRAGDVEKHMFQQREVKQVAWYTPPLSRTAPWTGGLPLGLWGRSFSSRSGIGNPKTRYPCRAAQRLCQLGFPFHLQASGCSISQHVQRLWISHPSPIDKSQTCFSMGIGKYHRPNSGHTFSMYKLLSIVTAVANGQL